MAQNLFQHAMGKDNKAVTAAIFWLTCQGNWKESQRLEVTGAGRGPIQSAALTKDEFREIARQLLDEV